MSVRTPSFNSASASASAGQRLVARGANEREPILELPPCPDEMPDRNAPRTAVDLPGPVASLKSSSLGQSQKKIRKRKSLMDLILD
jgi:hypothetical protein